MKERRQDGEMWADVTAASADARERLGAGRDGWSLWDVRDLLALPTPLFDACAVAMGTFDGVHRGHRRILHEAVAMATEKGWVPVAFTFDRHPAETLTPERRPALLTAFSERIGLIQAAGIAHVIVVRFDREFSKLEPHTFLERIVTGVLGARGIVVGYNFRFGRGATGDRDTLQTAARRSGFDLRVVPQVTVGREQLSSTRIRSCVERGDVEAASDFLGRPFTLAGRVVPGDARGRRLGYPTANLKSDDGLVTPGDGVYITEVSSDPGTTPVPQVSGAGRETSPKSRCGGCTVSGGLTVIGTRPSFGRSDRTIETFLLDFDGNLYDQRLRITFHRRLRGIVRFGSPEALIDQIEKDVAAARLYFEETERPHVE